MTSLANSTAYRVLINDQPITREKSVSFEPDHIQIIIYGRLETYSEWKKRAGETVNFKLTSSDINETVVISHVILALEMEEACQIILKLESPERVAERKSWMRK